jgi:hypothetical protein
MPPARRLYLPVADTEEEAEVAFRQVSQALVIELGTRFDVLGRAQLGPNWVRELVSSGHSVEEKRDWRSAFDPSFVFGEPIRYHHSILWRILPNNFEFKNKLKDCRWARNRWEHRQTTPSLQQLKADLDPYEYVAQALDLELSKVLPKLRERIDAVLGGSFVANEATQPSSVEAGAGEVPVEAEEAMEEDERQHVERVAKREAEAKKYPRPRVGGVWIGPKPTRALTFRRQLNDLADAVTRESVKAAWGDQASINIARLKMIDPMGDLYVDDADGALMGYKFGEARLLGYLGQEPARDLAEIQGFVLPRSYSLRDGEVWDETANLSLTTELGDSAVALTAVLNKAVNPIDEIKVTTHGDLFSITEDGPVKIARVTAEQWFPGQLPT